jgi:hypothetical protein
MRRYEGTPPQSGRVPSVSKIPQRMITPLLCLLTFLVRRINNPLADYLLLIILLFLKASMLLRGVDFMLAL